MMPYITLVILTIGAWLFAKRNGIRLEKNLMVMVVVIELGGFAVGGYDYYNSKAGFSGELERPQSGTAEREEKLMVESDGHEEEWTVKVSPRKFSRKESIQRLDQATKEINKTFLGKNRSLDNVTRPLTVKDSYAEGTVDAGWEFSDPTLVSSDGKILYENLEEVSPAIVYAAAKLSCCGEEKVYSFPLRLQMPSGNTKEGFSFRVDQALKQADAKDPTGEWLILPGQVGDIPLVWSKEQDNRGALLAALGLVAGAGVVLGRREEKRKSLLQQKKELTADYPDIVSALSLYVSAGITVRASFTRIFAGYRDRKRTNGIRDRPGYEAIGKVVRQMEDGVGEEAAYGALGRLTGHKDYGKLAMMLSKNLKHGSVMLQTQLEKEEAQAFEARKLAARTMGEEASTKLLVPMIMLLSVVIVVLIAPAFFSLQT